MVATYRTDRQTAIRSSKWASSAGSATVFPAPSSRSSIASEDLVRQADEPERRARPIDVETLEALEEALISADIGVAATERIIAAVRGRARSGESLRDLVKQEIRQRVRGRRSSARPPPAPPS